MSKAKSVLSIEELILKSFITLFRIISKKMSEVIYLSKDIKEEERATELSI